MKIIGYFWPESETTSCERCGVTKIRSMAFPAAGGSSGPERVPMHEGELGYDDGVRCDECGERLVEPAPAPTSFEGQWAKRMAARRETAIERAEAR